MTRVFIVGLLALCESVSYGHEVNQHVGGYKASNGDVRSAGGMGGRLERGSYGNSVVTSGVYNLDANVEKITVEDPLADKYMENNFPDGVRVQKTGALGATHTIKKLTDLRAGGSWTSDDVTTSRSWSGGVGHWWFQDTIQTNVDFSRTITDQPETSFLDYDAETIVLAPKTTSAGGTFSVKHLATPTTIWGGSYTRVESTSRPRLDAYTAQFRQFFPPISASLHSSVTRIINTGPVTTEMPSGSLAGVQAEVAVLKTLWKGAQSRAAYRYAREDEETRAYGDHLVYGADSYTLGLSQDINRGVITDRPLTASVVATRYMTNQGIAATLGEAGLAVKF